MTYAWLNYNTLTMVGTMIKLIQGISHMGRKESDCHYDTVTSYFFPNYIHICCFFIFPYRFQRLDCCIMPFTFNNNSHCRGTVSPHHARFQKPVFFPPTADSVRWQTNTAHLLLGDFKSINCLSRTFSSPRTGPQSSGSGGTYAWICNFFRI